MQITFLFFLFSSIILYNEANETRCTLKDGTQGICKNIFKCISVLNDWKRYQKLPVYCGDPEYEIGCCPIQNITNQTTNISQQKCLEYMQYTFEETRVVAEDPEDGFEIAHVDQCHISNTQFAIVGGENATKGEFPHMAAIGDDALLEDYIFWFCGGSLISENYVLSAAHCVKTTRLAKNAVVVPRLVKLGALDFDNPEEKYAQTIEIDSNHIHPEYKPEFVYHDIALLKLKKNVQLSPYVRPICLPTIENVAQSTSTTVIGWGKQKNEGYIGVLQKLSIPFIDHSICNQTYNPRRSNRIPQGLNERILCYGGVQGQDACPGASGGSIQIVNKAIYCSYTIVGVTSAGVKCTEGYPGLYTNVIEYLNWIENIVWN